MIKQKIKEFRETIKNLEVEGYYGNRYDIEDALVELDKIEQLVLSDVSGVFMDKQFINLVETRLYDYEIANDHKQQKKTSVDVFKGAIKWHYKID